MKRKHPIFLLSEIDEKYIAEADPAKCKATARRRRFLPLLIAVILCLTLTLSVTLPLIFNRENDTPLPSESSSDEETTVQTTEKHPQDDKLEEEEYDNILYSARGYDDIIKALINIYAAPQSAIEDVPDENIDNQYTFKPTYYFTLPHNNKPDRGVQGERQIVFGNYIFSAVSDGVEISEIQGDTKTAFCNVNIAYADLQDKQDMNVCAIHFSDDKSTMIVLLSDAFYKKSAIVTFDMSKFYSDKTAVQKSFVKLSGGYVKSSYIDGKLIFITEQRVMKDTFNISDFTTFLPYTSVGGNIKYSDINNIYITPKANRAVYTTVASFDVASDRLIAAKNVIGGHDVHITKSAVYLEKAYIYGDDESQTPNKSEILRFDYTYDGMPLTGYQRIDGMIYKDMLNESNRVLQILSSNGNFYCFDAYTLKQSLQLSAEAPTYYQTVRFDGNNAYLGHYCYGECSMAFNKNSAGMIVWTQEVDVSDAKSIQCSTPKQPYGSLIDFGDGYWLQLKYVYNEAKKSHKLVVSVLKESEGGMTMVDSIELNGRSLKYFPYDSANGVTVDEKNCDYYFDAENKLFGALLAPKRDGDADEYMLWQFDTDSETLKLSIMNTNQYYANEGGYYVNGYFFTVSAAGDLATKIETDAEK